MIAANQNIPGVRILILRGLDHGRRVELSAECPLYHWTTERRCYRYTAVQAGALIYDEISFRRIEA